MDTQLSCVLCVADMNITGALDLCLAELALTEVYVQRAKQISLVDRPGFLLLRPVTKTAESRALIYRIFIPSVYEEGVMRRIIEATDLRMGGRGSIFSQRINAKRGTPLSFDTARMESLSAKPKKFHSGEQALVSCVVPRGSGGALAEAALELGLCVPVMFFGDGMGMRDKLGLLRITIPVEKEIIWFLVPPSEAELVEKTLIHRARLDIPGQGFLYKFFVNAPVINLKLRQGKRTHAATMEQVIAAMDELRGSSEWRRQGSFGKRRPTEGDHDDVSARGLFFIGEEAEVETFRKTAMENGARGATLNDVEMYSNSAATGTKESRSRKLCDIIIPAKIEKKLLAALEETGLFAPERSSLLKTFDVEMPAVVQK